jgi:hypothetical protein
MLSASEDGCAKLWDVASGKCEFTFNHNKEAEVLRVAFIHGDQVICTCGADGKVLVWTEVDAATAAAAEVDQMESAGGGSSSGSGSSGGKHKRHFTQACTLDHGDAQVYVCEKLDIAAPSSAATTTESAAADSIYLCGGIFTAADDLLYLWDLSLSASPDPRTWCFRSIQSRDGVSNEEQEEEEDAARDVSSISDGETGAGATSSSSSSSSSGTGYGGPRNEENIAYIFDAKPCSMDPWKLAVACSDGTVRIVDTSRGNSNKRTECGFGARECINIASMVKAYEASQGQQGEEEAPAPPHVTGVAWSNDDGFLLVTLGDGKLVLLAFPDGKAPGSVAPKMVGVIKAHKTSCYGGVFLKTGTDADSDAAVNNAGGAHKPKRARLGIAETAATATATATAMKCITWSSDRSLAVWDLAPFLSSSSKGAAAAAAAAAGLEAESRLSLPDDFPLYSCCTAPSETDTQATRYVACCGGGGKSTFVGIPLHIVDIKGNSDS